MGRARKLSVSERLDLVEAIWERIAEEAGDGPVSEEYFTEAARRLEEYDADHPGVAVVREKVDPDQDVQLAKEEVLKLPE